jgi:hypothetical protein
MAHFNDWFPTTRMAILAMAIIWITVCTVKRLAWGIAGVALTEFTALKDAAQAALALIQDESTRTRVTIAECAAAFAALEDFMRDFKRRYFIKPPLTDADFISLGLKPPDSTRTPIDPPKEGPEFSITQMGRGALGIVYWYGETGRKGSKPKGVKGARIYYGFSAESITNQNLLTMSEWATRCPHVIRFTEADRGKRIYIALRWELGREHGESPWSKTQSELVT